MAEEAVVLSERPIKDLIFRRNLGVWILKLLRGPWKDEQGAEEALNLYRSKVDLLNDAIAYKKWGDGPRPTKVVQVKTLKLKGKVR